MFRTSSAPSVRLKIPRSRNQKGASAQSGPLLCNHKDSITCPKSVFSWVKARETHCKKHDLFASHRPLLPPVALQFVLGHVQGVRPCAAATSCWRSQEDDTPSKWCTARFQPLGDEGFGHRGRCWEGGRHGETCRDIVGDLRRSWGDP